MRSFNVHHLGIQKALIVLQPVSLKPLRKKQKTKQGWRSFYPFAAIIPCKGNKGLIKGHKEYPLHKLLLSLCSLFLFVSLKRNNGLSKSIFLRKIKTKHNFFLYPVPCILFLFYANKR